MEVAKSFTEELMTPPEKRTFEIGGELFKWRYLYWEDFTKGIDKDQAELAEAAKRAKKNGAAKEGDEPEEPETTFHEVFADYQTRIEPYLDPENEAVKRWRALCKRKDNPVPAHLFQALYMWLVEVTSGRPTGLPSPSGDGQQTTAPSSKAG